MNIPKYMTGDLVLLKNEFPSYMSHFKGAGKLAIVVGHDDWLPSRLDKEGDQEPKYALWVDGHGYSCWYDESLIDELIGTRKLELIESWQEDMHLAKDQGDDSAEISEEVVELVYMFIEATASMSDEEGGEFFDFIIDEHFNRLKEIYLGEQS